MCESWIDSWPAGCRATKRVGGGGLCVGRRSNSDPENLCILPDNIPSSIISYILGAVCVVEVFLHMLTPSYWERALWLPCVSIMLLASSFVAMRTMGRAVEEGHYVGLQ